MALAILPNGDGDFLFTRDGTRPLNGSNFKAGFNKVLGRGTPLPRWTLHDLRRTARSLMSRAGVPSDHAERCLGHVIGGVRGTYDRHEYYEEKRRAFEALASLVERIVNPQPNVVVMRGQQ
jgi:integrase